MKTVSKTLVSIVLLSLLLTWGSGRSRFFHRKLTGQSQAQQRDVAQGRLRRWRDGAPGHPPGHVRLMAAIDGDDDDDRERPHLSWKDTHHYRIALGSEGAHGSRSHPCRDRHLPSNVPLHQMLCHLLI